MESKIELQFDNDLQQLQTNVIKSIMRIENPEEIKAFKRKVWLAYHPDRKKSQVEKDIYTPLFQAVSNALKMEEDLASAIEYFDHSINHIYYAEEKIGNDRYIKKLSHEILFKRPTVKQSDHLLTSLKEIYQLTDADLESVHKIIEEHVIALTKQMLKIRKLWPLERLFLSNKQIEADLLFLINGTKDDELVAKIDLLKSSTIHYSSFEQDCINHLNAFCDLTSDFLASDEFKNNLYKIYLTIASKQREQQIHWLFKKQTHADLTGILLKTPAALLYSIVFLAMGLFLMLPPIMLCLPVELYALCAASVVVSVGMLTWAVSSAASLAFCLHYKIDAFEIIARPLTPFAMYIDRFVETIFNIQPHATELGNLLSEHDKKNQKQVLGKFGLFGGHQPRNEFRNEDDIDAGREVRLIMNGSR